MKKTIILILLLGIYLTLYSQTTYIVKQDGTGNFTSIQAAINATVHGDTIIVHNGRYFENINYNGKNIYLTSLFKYTNDRNDIYNTIIDAGHHGSAVVIRNNETRNAVLNGFTIENSDDPVPPLYPYAGAIRITVASPSIYNCLIQNNKGYAGIMITGYNSQSISHPFLSGNVIKNNTHSIVGGGLYLNSFGYVTFDPVNKNSIFSNHNGDAHEIFSTNSYYYIDIILDTFTVHPSHYEFYNHIYVFNGQYTFQADNYIIDSFINNDLYVNPLGDDELNNGLSWVSPFKTVAHAMYWIASDQINPKTIYLAEGVYKPSEGQMFPFIMKSYVRLQGAGPELTIFDSEQRYGFITSVKESRDFIIDGIGFENNSPNQPYSIMPMMRLVGVDEAIISNCNFNNGARGIWVFGYGDFDYTLNENANAIFKNLVFDGNKHVQIWPYIKKATYENIIIKNNEPNLTSSGYDNEPLVRLYYYQYRPEIIFNNLLIHNNTSYHPTQPSSVNNFLFGFHTNHDVLINNATITHNNLNPNVAGGPIIIVDRNTNVKVYNSIFYNNVQNNLYFDTSINNQPSRYYINNTLLQGGSNSFVNEGAYAEVHWGEGNIDEDPLFSDIYDEDYPFQLSDNSPAIDAGTLDIDWEGYVFPETDIMGNPRIVGGRIDMGAYQTQHLRADFTAEPLSGNSPLTVQFTSIMSEGEYTYEWDFDLDGVIDSIDENPSHTYTQDGLYSVRLVLNNGEKQVVKQDYINVGEVSEIDINLPAISDISEPYPNPFRGKTMFKANINEDGMVSMVVYNIRGQRVRTIINERKTVGIYQIVWDGLNDKGQLVASGIYTIEMKFNNKRLGNVKVSFIK